MDVDLILEDIRFASNTFVLYSDQLDETQFFFEAIQNAYDFECLDPDLPYTVAELGQVIAANREKLELLIDEGVWIV